MDLSSVIKRIRQGDERSFKVLYELLASDLYRFAYRYVKSDAIAQEIVQDSFVRLWNSRARLDPEQSPKAYIFTIAYHQILREFRQQLRNPLLRDYLEYAEALTEIAVGNFSARLSELKQDGYVFDKQIVHRKNRYGEDTYFCRYSNPRKISEV